MFFFDEEIFDFPFHSHLMKTSIYSNLDDLDHQFYIIDLDPQF